MSKKPKRKKQPHLLATVEIGKADLSLVIVDKSSEPHMVRGAHQTWLKEAESLSHDEAVADLAATLSELVVQERLTGAKVNIALSSDFCVTRVVAGENDRVRAEMRSLNDRSNQYLLLGAGDKAVAESTSAIDAKQTQAWLTVTNSRTLTNLTSAFSQAGLQVRLIEHDMVAICRAVGHMDLDNESPVIVVKLNEYGVVLGVSYKGTLLFDYRPGGVDCKGRIAEIVHRHLDRIQRYCNRQFRFATGEISKVLLCGSDEEIESARKQFSESRMHLEPVALVTSEVFPDWKIVGELGVSASSFAAAGSALVEDERLGAAASGRGMPNLMDYVLNANRAPLLPSLIRTAWPIAAVLMLAVGVYSAAIWKGSSASALEAKVQQFEAQMGSLEAMKRKTTVTNTKLKYLKGIEESLMHPAWHELLAWIGQSMPEGVGLDTFRVDHDGTVSITGPGASEEMIFEFVGYLKQIPVLDQVNLEAQRPIKLPQGTAIKFDIKCKFNDQRDLVERTASND